MLCSFRSQNRKKNGVSLWLAATEVSQMTTTATTSNASSAPIELEKATSKLLDSYMKSTSVL
jgi:hypothetical protein